MATIYGSNFSEDIDGTNNSDVIYGYGGADWIYGYGGNDLIYAGTGNDVVEGGSGNDDIYGNAGVNDLYGGSGFDWFIMSGRGNAASDDWIGDFQFDVDSIDVSRWGISDFSQIRALVDTDSSGSAYFDAFYDGYNHFLTIDGVTANQLVASDFIYSNSGPNDQTGTSFDDVLFGSRYAETLLGGGGEDELLGGIGGDLLKGGVGNDVLIGGRDDDSLLGGAGHDVLTGSQGADTFIFTKLSDSRPDATRDRISDFHSGVDKIDLSVIDADATTAGNQAFDYIDTAAFSAAGQVMVSYVGNNTLVSASTDNDGAAEFQVLLNGHLTLTDTDFIL